LTSRPALFSLESSDTSLRTSCISQKGHRIIPFTSSRDHERDASRLETHFGRFYDGNFLFVPFTFRASTTCIHISITMLHVFRFACFLIVSCEVCRESCNYFRKCSLPSPNMDHLFSWSCRSIRRCIFMFSRETFLTKVK